MARFKNALTKYEIGAIPTGSETVTYSELAKWITSVGDETDEQTDDAGYYDGTGEPVEEVMSVKQKYSFEGYYDESDTAMKMIHDMIPNTGSGRKLMFKVTENGGRTHTGIATVTGITAGRGGGDANEYAAFKCSISFDSTPTVTEPTPPQT